MVYQQVYLVMETKNIHCLGLNKPNKPVYFSMHSLTGQWELKLVDKPLNIGYWFKP